MSPQRRHELTDEQGDRLAPLLPPQRPRTGRRAKDHRTILNGIRWIVRIGAPRRDLPARYGPWQTVYSQFRRWREAGLWDRLLLALQTEAAHAGTLDDTLAIIDGTNIRAHHQVVGRKRGRGAGTRAESRRLGEQKVREDFRKFAGMLTPEEGESLKELIYRGREEGTQTLDRP